MSESTPAPKTSRSIGRVGSLTHIGDVVIEARESARMKRVNSDEIDTMKTIDYIVLADGTEAYQCVYPGSNCYLAFDNVRSTFAHQKAHSAKTRVKKVEAQLTELQKAKAQEFSRRSNGQRIGAERREQRIAEIETIGLAEALRREATVLEERVLWLRAMALIADQAGRASTVPAEELAQLRADAEQFQQLKSLLGK